MINVLVVPLEDRPGRLYDVASAISGAGVDMKALALSHSGAGVGEVRLIVTHLTKARDALWRVGFEHRLEQAVALEVPDRTGGLASILQLAAGAGLSVRFLFTFVTRIEGKALAVAAFDDNEKAERTLKTAGMTTLDQRTVEAQRPERGDQGQASIDYYLGGTFFW